MNEIDALLGIGLGQEDSATQMRNLAHQLRGQQQLGDVYSMSPTLAPQGRQMNTDARGDATRIGALNRTMGRDAARDAQDAERNRIADERNRLFGERTAADAADTSGSGGWRSYKIPGSEEAAFIHPKTKEVWIPRTGDKFANVQDAIASGIALRAEGASAEKAGENVGKLGIEEIQDNITSVAELDGVYSEAIRGIDNMQQAINDGANTGQVAALFPTFIDATSRFESAKEGATLEMLKKYKLTPVSDKDYAALQQAAQPKLSPDQMREFLTHKKEGIQRMKKANTVMEQYLRTRMRGNQGMPTPEERESIRAEMDAILYGGGYDFAHEYGVGGTSGPTRPSFVAADDWANFSPEQKQQLAQ